MDGDDFQPGPVKFELLLPMDKAQLQANVDHALSLGLPEADDRDMRLNIVANGPSARGAEFHGATMAINGAIRLFGEDNPPDFWCVADPQGLVANFLPPEPPRGTVYLIASKCHPAVFERLAGYDVRIWHVSDLDLPGRRQVPCATTTMLTALLLAQRIGFRTIDTWGWDCCFAADGTHHAGPGELGTNVSIIDVEVGGKWEFKTTSSWALEVKEAADILPILRWAGVDVKIHGAGMVGAVACEFAADDTYKREKIQAPA